ncbi:MAG: aminoacyl-tRNA hydrolase [Pseudarcicella sp.]|nr:aminoacyl-tRNA hydrolase [Pseudarcicella sp.]
MKYLIVGLGNIGPEYLFTRHNIGFMALDFLANQHDSQFTIGRLAYHTEIKIKGRQIHLIKPTTYMNLSGKALNHWMKDLKVEPENVLVITDDIALPFAKTRLKLQGTHGGHNGLRNIQEILNTPIYNRLRFGVGSDFSKGRQAEYVLANFSEAELQELSISLDKIKEIILSFVFEGVQKTMNKFNS